MKYRVGCSLSYDVLTPTLFIVGVEVQQIEAHRSLSERFDVSPEVERRTLVRPDTGNRIASFMAQPGPLSINYEAEIDLAVISEEPARIGETPIAELPLEIFPYLLPSRFSPSDKLTNFAAAEFGSLPAGHVRVTAICNWIHDHTEYRRGSSDAETSALDTLLARSGVCRDFAHLGVAFCRAIGIPARFVSCYAHGLEPADFHAVFEAYLDGHWWLFDPTRQASLDGLVRIGVGRDAADVSFTTFFGSIEPKSMNLFMEAPGRGANELRTVEAIRVE